MRRGEYIYVPREKQPSREILARRVLADRLNSDEFRPMCEPFEKLRGRAGSTAARR